MLTSLEWLPVAACLIIALATRSIPVSFAFDWSKHSCGRVGAQPAAWAGRVTSEILFVLVIRLLGDCYFLLCIAHTCSNDQMHYLTSSILLTREF